MEDAEPERHFLEAAAADRADEDASRKIHPDPGNGRRRPAGA
jgi:hypothetical protein